MSDKNRPNFQYWEHSSLAKLAGDQHDQFIELREKLEKQNLRTLELEAALAQAHGVIEHMRTDLRDAMKLVRESNK